MSEKIERELAEIRQAIRDLCLKYPDYGICAIIEPDETDEMVICDNNCPVCAAHNIAALHISGALQHNNERAIAEKGYVPNSDEKKH